MTIREITNEYLGKFADYEIYKAEDARHCMFPHTDYIKSVELPLDTELEEFEAHLMDQDEYDRTILANADHADFAEWYGDAEAKVLVIVFTGEPVNRIKQLREKTGLSQKAFGDKFGIPLRTVQNWEYGVNDIPDYLLRLIEQEVESKKQQLFLSVTYTNGNTIERAVNYVHFEDGKIFYTLDDNPHEVIQQIISVPTENISAFNVYAK